MSQIITQYFHYEIKEVRPLSALEEFKDHKRLKIFHQKINPVTKIPSVQIEGKPDSYYHTNRIYFKK